MVSKILVKKHHKQKLERLINQKLKIEIHQKLGSSENTTMRTWTKEKPLDRLPRLIRFQL
jgi:hypothetical protein